MQDLRHLVNQKEFSDAPEFSDELLLPSIALGHHVSLATAFVPSYVVRLVNDLASSPEIEPGKLHIVFCVPFRANEKLSQARLFSKYLSAFATSSSEVKKFIESVLQLAREGGLRLSILFSGENQLLTPSCLGLIESGIPGSNDYLALVDSIAGDLNSPITIQESWDSPGIGLAQVASLVGDSKDKQFANLYRVDQEQVLAIFREILQKGYPKQDLAHLDKTLPKDAPKKRRGPGKTSASQTQLDEDDEDFVDISEIFEDIDSEIDDILREVHLREAGFDDDDLAAFLGGYIDDSLIDVQIKRSSGRGHIGPLSYELVAIIGHGYATCWCGEGFDREFGCPNGFD